MQKRKLQVFVSSTFIDLIEERQAAVQAILNAGHIPAGMELFIAGDESQWEIIKEWIDESDIYMLIIGGRYGSIEPKTNKSYTHLEYEYALSMSKPHFVIIIDDATTQKKAKKEGVRIIDFFDNSPALKEFKDSIMKGKLVSICDNLDKMESSIHKSINKLSQRDNLKGWVKAEDTDYSSISEELACLSKENSELKSQLAEVSKFEKINGYEIDKFALFLKEIKTTRVELTNGLVLSNLLQFFYNFCDRNLRTILKESTYGYEDYYSDCYRSMIKYGFYESKDSKITDTASKLLVYLELNQHLLETED